MITVNDQTYRFISLLSRFNVQQVLSYGGYVLHIGSLEQGKIQVGDKCTCSVDYERRLLIAPNHTLTHVMNWALRRVLETDVDQKGSLVDDQKLRFDFNNTKPVSPAQLAEIERLVNEKVNAALSVYTAVTPINEAREICSLRAVFGEVSLMKLLESSTILIWSALFPSAFPWKKSSLTRR